jgi:hypothetical protein
MSDTPVYASEEHPAPDSAFAAGELRHLVVGNRGRLLDARRTPNTVVDVAPQRGAFVVRIEAFEDTGARWELGLEEIERFQFTRTATPASDAALAELHDSTSPSPTHSGAASAGTRSRSTAQPRATELSSRCGLPRSSPPRSPSTSRTPTSKAAPAPASPSSGDSASRSNERS